MSLSSTQDMQCVENCTDPDPTRRKVFEREFTEVAKSRGAKLNSCTLLRYVLHTLCHI